MNATGRTSQSNTASTLSPVPVSSPTRSCVSDLPTGGPAIRMIGTRDARMVNPEELAQLAQRHLWMHFTSLGSYATRDVPVMARGEGCYVYDASGKRYLDGLSGLFTVQVGHGRRELAAAAARQAETLEYFPIWSYAHPPAIELAAR